MHLWQLTLFSPVAAQVPYHQYRPVICVMCQVLQAPRPYIQARRLGEGGGGGSVGSVEPPRPSKLDPLAQLASWFRLPSLVPLAVAGSASFRFFPLTMN